jgi:replicative DNA helicase
MLVDKELIIKAKQKYGEKAAEQIAHDLKIDKWDEKALKGCCPIHGEDTPSFIWNEKNNSFHCFGCNINYSILDHWMKFENLTYLGAVEKLFEATGTQFRFGEKGLKIAKDYRYPFYDKSNNRVQVEDYLAKRKISKETLDYCDVQQDAHTNIVFNFYDTNDVLTLVKYRPSRLVTKDDRFGKSWCQKDADAKPILFNMNRIDPTIPLLITEGEIDCLSAIEAGFLNAVSVPLGSQNVHWIEENWDWLEQFDKVIVWSDNDEAGIKMRKEVCTRLGIYKTLFVDIPPDLMFVVNSKFQRICKDANEVLYQFGKEKVLELILNAQEMPLVGVVDLAQVDEFDIEKAPGLFTGLESMQDIVYKFLFGSVITVTGMRGAGKSTLLNQMFVCQPLHQGYDVFCFSGELAPPVLKSWIELTMAGPEHTHMKEGNKFVHIIEDDAKKKMRDWYNGRIWIYNQVSNKSADIFEKAIAVTRKYGVKVWLLDNLTTIDIDANDNNMNVKQKEFMVELIKLAALYNVLIVLVVHPRKILAGQELNSNDVAGSSSLTDLAQYVLAIKRFSKREKEGEKDGRGNYKKGKEPIDEDVEVNTMKNRYTGKIGDVRLYFDYCSYRFYGKLEEMYTRFKWDINAVPAKMVDPRSSPFLDTKD